jgi:acyl-CoA reductase-like NAD-dependent aldehyde dehydrogenase
VLARAGELARALTLEGGKPVEEAEGEPRWGGTPPSATITRKLAPAVAAGNTVVLGRAHRVVEALEYGMVAINDGAPGWVQAPFGGIKGSGDAREGGRLGLEDSLDVQYLGVNF